VPRGLSNDIVRHVASIVIENEFSLPISLSAAFALYTSYFDLSDWKGPKQFQGLDPKMEGTADEFKAASAKDAVEEGVLDGTEVDFEWVVRGFLSYYFPLNHGWKGESDIRLAVLSPFLACVAILALFVYRQSLWGPLVRAAC
jgi:hypothetical protein